LFEREVLRRVREVSATSEHPGRLSLVEFIDDFEHDGPEGKHVCLVFELLGESVDSQMSDANRTRLPYPVAKCVTKQVLEALDFLHNECQVLHTDVQTSNLLLEGIPRKGKGPSVFRTQDANIRLNDLGLACWTEEHLTDRIQPPLLRAPEITLDAPWEAGVDVYSVGCLSYYFVTGTLPFPGRPAKDGTWSADDDRLKTVTNFFGPVPDVVLTNAEKGQDFFDDERKLRRRRSSTLPPLEEVISRSQKRGSLNLEMPSDEVPVFCDFLREALATDPRERKTAKELTDHPWLREPGLSPTESSDPG